MKSKMLFIYIFFKAIILYLYLSMRAKKTGPKTLWKKILKRKRKKHIKDVEYSVITRVLNVVFSNIVKSEKCIVESTLAAYLLNSDAEIILKLGHKNKNYSRYQLLKYGNKTSVSNDFHCWVTFNGIPVKQPFYEFFWNEIYIYEVK